MTTNLLIAGLIVIGYIAFAIVFHTRVSNIEDEEKSKKAQSVFIGINIVLLCVVMTYMYLTFL